MLKGDFVSRPICKRAEKEKNCTSLRKKYAFSQDTALTFLMVGAIVLITAAAMAHDAESAQTKTSRALMEKSISTPDEYARVIIKMKNATDESLLSIGAESAKSVKGSAVPASRRILKKGLRGSDYVAAEIPLNRLNDIASDKNIEYIAEDLPVYPFLSESVPVIGADSVWNMQIEGQNITGRGTTICIIDTGVDYTHPDLGSCGSVTFLAGNCKKVVSGYDFVNNDANPIDDNGHGTHVAGIAAGNGTLKGVAPDAKIVAIKALSAAGPGYISDIVSGIDWCVSNATKYNISVISMSLGEGSYSSYCDNTDEYSILYATAIDAAVANNISVVVATGNDAYTTAIARPACITNATRVTATDESDAYASFANRASSFPDTLTAPGVSICSAKAAGTALGLDCVDSQHISAQGTSLSAPHVSGAVALLQQTYRLLYGTNQTPAYFEDLLNSTGKKISDAGTGVNFSRINVSAAYEYLWDNAPPTAIAIITPQNGSSVNKNFSEIIATNSYASWMNFSVDGGENISACSVCSSFTNRTANLTDGLHNITVYGAGVTGAINQTTSYFTIDTVPPYELSVCQNLTEENGTYVLTQNVSSAGTCFTISANNITLDGAGYTINYSKEQTGYGINNSGGYDNITIKNLNIVQENAAVSYAYAIYLAGAWNGSITNNTINTSGTNGAGIFVYSISNSNNIANNTVTTSGSGAFGIHMVSSSETNTIRNNTITTSGDNGYGIYLAESSDYNTLLNNTIKTAGRNSYGIHIISSSNLNASGNAMNTTNAYALYISIAVNPGPYYNHTIDITNTEQGAPIYYYFENSSVVIENLTNIGELFVANSTNVTVRNVTLDKNGIVFGYVTNSTITRSNITASSDAISLSGSNSSTIFNNTISASGAGGRGIYLESSVSNNIANNAIATSGTLGPGILLYSSSNLNSVADNNITTSGESSEGILTSVSAANTLSNNMISTANTDGYGIYLYYSNNTAVINNTVNASAPAGGYGIALFYSYFNRISGGSVISQQSYDYYLGNSNNTNNFTNTNFTGSRKIYFYDRLSYFNYNNDSSRNIWLKTNVSNASYITRTLTNWSSTLMRWNDTNSTAKITANYTITGMQATSIYIIYNISGGVQKNPYNLTTDASGNLPPFRIALKDNTEIRAEYYGPYVAPAPDPTCSDGIQNGDETGIDCGGSCAAACAPADTGSADIITNFLKSTPANNPVTKIEIYLKSSMTNPVVSVTKLQTVSFGAPKELVYQYLEISKNNFNNSDINESTIEFKVNKSWIVSNNIESVHLLRYEGGWTVLETRTLNSTENYTTYSAKTPGFSYFAIAGKAAPSNKTENASQVSALFEEDIENSTESTAQNPVNTNEYDSYQDTPENKTGTITSGLSSYGWIVALALGAVVFIAAAFVIIDRNNKKKGRELLELAKQPQQKLIDPKIAAEYIDSRKKLFEDAETEYLIERLKEAKKLTQ